VTTRERTLSITVGIFLALFAAGGVGYFFVLQPIQEKTDRANRLEVEIADKKLELAKIVKNRPRLQAALARSLPADPEVAKQEYVATLIKLCQDANVPATSYSVNPKAPDSRPTPEVAPKKPAYTRVAVEVELTKVNYATVLDVLHRYYQLNLLHQITKFNLKAAEGARTVMPQPGARYADRPDLTVTFTTEAASLDGAERRRSLLSVPVAMGAAGGGAGHQLLAQSPTPARHLTPLQYVPVLSTAGRDYTALLDRDVFHGQPPPKPVEVVKVDPPKEDTSPFIRLSSFGRNDDGTGNAVIEDTAIKYDYVIEVTRSGGRIRPVVTKFYYSKGGRKRLDDPSDTLDISEETSGTARKFRVVGLDQDGVVLVARPPADAGGRRPGGLPRRPPPAAAAAGFAVIQVPPGTVCVWRIGEPLSKVRELSDGDGRRAIARALGEEGATRPAGERVVGAEAELPPPPDGDG
jgi:hypothetical protein